MVESKLVLRLEDEGVAEGHAASIWPWVEAEPADRPRYAVCDGRAASRILARLGIGHVAPLLDGERHRDLT